MSGQLLVMTVIFMTMFCLQGLVVDGVLTPKMPATEAARRPAGAGRSTEHPRGNLASTNSAIATRALTAPAIRNGVVVGTTVYAQIPITATQLLSIIGVPPCTQRHEQPPTSPESAKR